MLAATISPVAVKWMPNRLATASILPSASLSRNIILRRVTGWPCEAASLASSRPSTSLPPESLVRLGA